MCRNLIFSVIIILLINNYNNWKVECSPSTLRAKYLESCNKSLRCDTVASLSCHNGTCQCIKPDSMMFDTDRQICVALAGEKCKFTVVEEYRSWLEEVACVQNSRCQSPGGICTCEPTFQEQPNGTCTPQKQIGERCNSSQECRTDLHLSCDGGECKCDPEKAIFSYSHGQCVGRGDRPCLNDRCTANALCRGYYGGHTIDSYEEYSGEDTKCICESGYTMSQDGLCQVGHGGVCDFVDTQCLDKFKCKDGRCVCPFESHQVYDETYRDCLSLIDGPCTHPPVKPSSNGGGGGGGSSPQNQNISLKNLGQKKEMSPPIYCMKPSVCQLVSGSSSRHHCVCPEGTISNADRRCDLTFGRICQTDRERSPQCDTLAPLFCIGGKCQCEDEFKFYDAKLKKCRGLVGSDCKLEIPQDAFCVDGAHCQRFRGSSFNGTCQCKMDWENLVRYLETENRTCTKNL